MGPSAERQLWCAVIDRALQDAVGEVGAVSGTAGRRRATADARGWILRDSTDFRIACDAAGYDPDVLRTRLSSIIRKRGAPSLE